MEKKVRERTKTEDLLVSKYAATDFSMGREEQASGMWL